MTIHIALPKNAMIRSKSGKTIAMSTGTATVSIRINALYNPRRRGGEGEVVAVIEFGASPRRMSSVVLIGLVFKGILVIGIIAIAETTIELRISGYPVVPRILWVIFVSHVSLELPLRGLAFQT